MPLNDLQLFIERVQFRSFFGKVLIDGGDEGAFDGFLFGNFFGESGLSRLNFENAVSEECLEGGLGWWGGVVVGR